MVARRRVAPAGEAYSLIVVSDERLVLLGYARLEDGGDNVTAPQGKAAIVAAMLEVGTERRRPCRPRRTDEGVRVEVLELYLPHGGWTEGGIGFEQEEQRPIK